MPIIICSYCDYIGFAKSEYTEPELMWQDVEEHEKTCPEKPEDESNDTNNRLS